MIFTSNRSGGVGGSDLWETWYNNNSWSPPSLLTGNINSTETDAEPHYIPGTKAVIFFASNKSGGYGLHDLYISTYISNWQTPVNLGPDINTSSNEYAPTVTGDGLTMYFASDRPGGYGGYDLYLAKYSNGKWGSVQNLGSVVNTSVNESQPFITPDGNFLYFVSDGPGGYGGADIWVTQRNVDIVTDSLGIIKALYR
ncbi:MAG: TolB family protein [bacterium]